MLQDATAIMHQLEMERVKNDRIYAVKFKALYEECSIKLEFLVDRRNAQLALCENEQEAREVEENFNNCATVVLDTYEEGLKETNKNYMVELKAINEKAPKYD